MSLLTVAKQHLDQHFKSRVPAAEKLFLFRLKDEGILFYYGRPARRLASPAQLPSSGEPLYCMLTEDEWHQWPRTRPAELLQRLRDQQGDPIVLVRVAPWPAPRLASRRLDGHSP